MSGRVGPTRSAPRLTGPHGPITFDDLVVGAGVTAVVRSSIHDIDFGRIEPWIEVESITIC